MCEGAVGHYGVLSGKRAPYGRRAFRIQEGKKHKSQSRSKNSDIGDYRRATGFEAVLGYLHYQNEGERLQKLMEAGLSFLLEREEGK